MSSPFARSSLHLSVCLLSWLIATVCVQVGAQDAQAREDIPDTEVESADSLWPLEQSLAMMQSPLPDSVGFIGAIIVTAETPFTPTATQPEPTGTVTETPTETPAVTSTPAETPTATPTQFAVISGTVFEDWDGDGVWDDTETGLPGVLVEVFPVGTPAAATPTITDSSGNYSFTITMLGDYTVRETDPDGYFSTTPNAVILFVEPGNSYPVNFGDAPESPPLTIIYGTVFHDLNFDGIQDLGEVGLADVLVELFPEDATAPVVSATTQSQGVFTILAPNPGAYRVLESDPPGFRSITPNEVHLFAVAGGTNIVNFADTKIVYDYGDAPDPSYATLHASDGARHIVFPSIYLGAAIDDEADGQPTADADGDDTSGVDDEDGVSFTTLLVAGGLASVDVVASTTGALNAWVDFNADGDWSDADEQILTDDFIVAGTSSLNFSVPSSAAAVDTTYARFRFCTTAGASFSGTLPDGEVEDYTIQILQPTHTPTHTPTETPTGTPTLTPTPGRPVYGTVFADLNSDGTRDVGEPGIPGVTVELFIDESPVPVDTQITDASGAYSLTYSVQGMYRVHENDPAGYWSTTPNDIFLQLPDDEILFPIDFGDAPVPAVVSGVVFEDPNGDGVRDPGEGGLAGVLVEIYSATDTIATATTTTDTEGQYSFSLTTPGSYKVIETDPIGYWSTTPNEVDLQVEIAGSYTVDFGDALVPLIAGYVFEDLNVNRVRDPGEDGVAHVLIEIYSATDTIAMATTTTDPQGQYSFPLASLGSYQVVETDLLGYLSTTANTVEVSVVAYEIYFVDFGDTYRGFDYGDAPDPPYQTLNASDGARHAARSPLAYLGMWLDWEEDGQPSFGADADDLNGFDDDEDGVVFTTPLVVGGIASVDVVPSTTAYLNAWVDFNANGDWGDAEDHIVVDALIVPPVTTLNFSVPNFAVPTDLTYARFRICSQTPFSFFGEIPDGEVEDYAVEILRPTATPTPTPRFRFACSDINGDGIIDGLDLLLLIEDWHHGFNLAPVPTPRYPCSDVNGDQFVDDEDLVWLMWDWNLPVEPRPTPTVPLR